jgi:hypothetical protein
LLHPEGLVVLPWNIAASVLSLVTLAIGINIA